MKIKALTSLFMAVVLIFTMSIPAAASASNTDTPTVITDNATERVAISGDTVARFDKLANTITIEYPDSTSYTFSLDATGEAEPGLGRVAVTTLYHESVALHAYSYKVTENDNYFYAIDIPSWQIDSNLWCGEILIWDNGTKEAEFCESFRTNIDTAQDAEHALAVYGGATIIGVAVGVLTSPTGIASLKIAKETFKLACTAAGIIVGYGALDAFGDLFSSIDNAREDYYAVRAIVG